MLTVVEIRNAKPRDKAYKLADGQGLYLYVSPTGAKSWRLKYRFDGVEKLLVFGLFPGISLSDARAMRDEAKAKLREGVDPSEGRPKRSKSRHASPITPAAPSSAPPFSEVADAWLQAQWSQWSEAHRVRVRYRLQLDLYPEFGSAPIDTITARMVLDALRKIEGRGSIETARRVKSYVVAIFRRARGEMLVSRDVLAEMEEIGAALRPVPLANKQPALTELSELIEFQRDIDRSPSDLQTKLLSRLLAITAPRIGVLRTAEWPEFEGIDWDDPDADAPDAIWTVPAERMKLEVDEKADRSFSHDYPLPRQAVRCLHILRRLNGSYRYVFPGRDRSIPMSDSSLSALYKRVRSGYYKGRMVPHGWRAAFSTLMNERAAMTGRDGDRMVIDMMLAHVPKGMSSSEWAYNRARYLKRRRELAQAWADMIMEGLPDPFDLLAKG